MALIGTGNGLHRARDEPGGYPPGPDPLPLEPDNFWACG